jgi:actin-related protein
LVLYSTGRTTGLVVDFGRDSTRAVTVFGDTAIPHTINEGAGGHDLDEKMRRLLIDEGLSVSPTSFAELEIDR